MPQPGSNFLRVFLHAGAKKAASLIRSLGLVGVHPQWQARTELCVRCPIATSTHKGLFCGQPFLTHPHRKPEQGCGCPILAKAKDPKEHCPVDPFLIAIPDPPPLPPCPGKWCQAGLGPK
jgi:hypothetical protein